MKNTSLIINAVLGAQLLVHLGGWFYLKGEREEVAPVAANKQTAIIDKFVADEAERIAAEWAAAEAERIAIEKAAAEKVVAEKRRVREAITRAEEFLLTMQQPNGAFSDPKSRYNRYEYAMTSLSLLALASNGHKPIDLDLKGIAMTRGLDFVLRVNPRLQRSGGYFGVDGSRMYGHGITTLCLTTIMRIGVHPRQEARLGEVTQQAVELILTAQRVRKRNPSHRGGWRYTLTSRDSDLSISIWQILALVSAKNAGINVPDQSIDLAVRYLKRSYFSGRNARGMPVNMRSGCGYLPGQKPTFAMTSAGLLGLQKCNEGLSPESKGSANWLAQKEVNPKSERWFYFGTYFYSQAMRGEGKGRQKTQEVLLGLQQANGSWVANSGSEGGAGRVYSTALALASLNAVKQ